MPSLPHRKKSGPTFLLLDARFSLSDAPTLLTRFVIDPSRPNDDFAPDRPPPDLLDPLQTYKIADDSFKSLLEDNKRKSVSAALTKFFAPNNSSQESQHRSIEARRVITYRLKQHGKMFQKMLADDGVKNEVLELLAGSHNGRLCMIVGFKTYFDASVTRKVGVAKSVMARGTFSAQGLLPTMQGGGPAVGAGARHTHNMAFSESHDTVEKETVFAVEYKVVKDKKGLWQTLRDPASGGVLTLSGSVASGKWGNAVYGKDKDEDGEEAGEETDEEDDGTDEDLGLFRNNLGRADIGDRAILLF